MREFLTAALGVHGFPVANFPWPHQKRKPSRWGGAPNFHQQGEVGDALQGIRQACSIQRDVCSLSRIICGINSPSAGSRLPKS